VKLTKVARLKYGYPKDKSLKSLFLQVKIKAMLHNDIQKFLPDIKILLMRHKIKEAYVFGSAITRDFTDTSDIDLIVNLQDNIDPVEAGGHLWDLQEELEDLFKRHIDLITERSLKNPYFIEEINRTKVRIYG